MLNESLARCYSSSAASFSPDQWLAFTRSHESLENSMRLPAQDVCEGRLALPQAGPREAVLDGYAQGSTFVKLIRPGRDLDVPYYRFRLAAAIT